MQTYLGTNVDTATSSPSILSSGAIIKFTIAPIDTTTTSKSVVDTVLVARLPTETSSHSIRTTGSTVDNNNYAGMYIIALYICNYVIC